MYPTNPTVTRIATAATIGMRWRTANMLPTTSQIRNAMTNPHPMSIPRLRFTVGGAGMLNCAARFVRDAGI
jgi:hypothetical protein